MPLPERGAAGHTPRAQLCFGQVRHKRLRPVVNAFEYRAYYLRLPVVVGGAAAVAPIGCALFSHNRFNLLSFYDRDHGDGTTPLAGWIDALLRREGVFDADGDIWLQAMPRVLGFVFNPVSFWFCHRADGQLRAVLCDVRNTFGERHFYLLDNGAVLAAFFNYPLMTLGVVARIHFQALRLFLKRLPFHPKPVPPQQKVTR